MVCRCFVTGTGAGRAGASIAGTVTGIPDAGTVTGEVQPDLPEAGAARVESRTAGSYGHIGRNRVNGDHRHTRGGT